MTTNGYVGLLNVLPIGRTFEGTAAGRGPAATRVLVGVRIMTRPRRRRIVACFAVLAPVLLGAGLLVVSAVPAQAIEVQSQSPVAGEEAVPVNANVVVTFDVPARGVTATTFTLTRIGGLSVPATVTGDVTNRTFTLNPNADLDGGTSYTAALSDTITDEGGAPFAGASWSFTTDAATPPPTDNTAPTVTDRTPGGAVTGVNPLVTVSATFSEEVQGVNETTFTLERTSTGVDVPAVVFRRGTTNRWSINPDDPLLEGRRYTARLDGGPVAIRDLAGNSLADTDWSFRVAAEGDTVRPEVVSRVPRAGATGVNRATDVRVVFSETVRGVNDATFTLTHIRTDSDVAASVFRNGSSRHWVLDPARTLRRGTRYVVTLSGGRTAIRSLDGAPLRFTTWSFRTR
jgi:hypothetical protein